MYTYRNSLPRNEDSVIIYSTSCHSKAVCSFFSQFSKAKWLILIKKSSVKLLSECGQLNSNEFIF